MFDPSYLPFCTYDSKKLVSDFRDDENLSMEPKRAIARTAGDQPTILSDFRPKLGDFVTLP